MNSKLILLTVVLACALPLAWAAQPDQPAQPTTNPTGVTLINIHQKQALPEEIFDELAKQGGIKFTTNGNFWDQDTMQTPLDVDFTNKPFWSATKEACNLWGLSVQTGWGGPSSGRKIMLNYMGNMNGRKTQPLPSCESNGCVVEAQAFNRQQNLNYENPDASQNYCSLQLMVYLDPALRVRNFNQNAKAELAVDDQGNSMMPDKNNNMFYGGGMSQASLVYNCNVPLKFPANAGKKIADFKCTLSLRAADKIETLSVDKPMEAAETSKDFAGTTITFQSVKKSPQANGGYEVKVNVTSDSDVVQNGNIWNLLQTAQLLDDKGHPFQYGGGGGGGNDEYTIHYSNNGDEGNTHGEPAKWTIELPTQVHTVKVPVEFKDLPLP